MLESNDIDVFNEVASIIDIADYLNEEDLLTAILQEKIDDPITVIKGLDNNFGDVFTEKLYKLINVVGLKTTCSSFFAKSSFFTISS